MIGQSNKAPDGSGAGPFRGGTDWTSADVRGRPASDAELLAANLSEANLGDARLSELALHKGDLRRIDVRGVRLLDTDLGGADLTQANLADAVLTRVSLNASTVRFSVFDRANVSSVTYRSWVNGPL